MGLLVGESAETLTFPDSKPVQRLLKANAALQLAKLLVKFEHFVKSPEDSLLFGTELECHLLRRFELIDHDVYSVFIDSKPVMAEINERFPDVEVKEEFSAWMMEFIPKEPFKHFLSLAEIRTHFKEIHRIADLYTNKLTLLPGLSVLPHIGTANYYVTEPNTPGTMVKRSDSNPYSQSDFFLDATITQHSRFKTFTQNTRLRAGKKPEIILPVLQDANTKMSKFSLDHFGFGMCNTALQITYSCRNLKEARFAHDQMHIIGPMMLAFSSTTFAASHRLLDIDNRFTMIEQSTDDRKVRERTVLDKTRYSTINFFLSDSPKLKNKYNNKKPAINKRFFKALRKLLKQKGSKLANDKRLLIHFSYLFIRDYLIVFPERIQKGFDGDSLEFEAIQSSNWQNMRLKPPSSFDSNLGWLLEFRPMDAPVTEIEKSLLTFLTTIFFRIVTDTRMDVNFYLPMTLVDTNFKRSFLRDSQVSQKFYARKHFCPLIPGYVESDDVVEVTLDEFWNGGSQFAGIKALFAAFIALNEKELAQASKEQKEPLVALIWKAHGLYAARATGALDTTPNLFRKFVYGHKEYQGDSYINDLITTDLIDLALDIGKKNYEKTTFGEFMF